MEISSNSIVSVLLSNRSVHGLILKPLCIHATAPTSLAAAHSTVAIDWDMELKKQCYDEQEAEVSWSFIFTQSWDMSCKQWIMFVYMFCAGLREAWEHAPAPKKESHCCSEGMHRAFHNHGDAWRTRPMVRFPSKSLIYHYFSVLSVHLTCIFLNAGIVQHVKNTNRQQKSLTCGHCHAFW